MKIVEIKGYKTTSHSNHGINNEIKKDNNEEKQENTGSYSKKVSVAKMLPVMMALAGMQPAAASASLHSASASSPAATELTMNMASPDPQVPILPKSDRRYDPQYDGLSKYLQLNLNELYFYVYGYERTPKLIDINSLFDRYMDKRVNWEKFRRDNNLDMTQMSMIQRAVAYFEKLYVLRQYESRDALRDGKPDPYSPEALAKRPKLRAHYYKPTYSAIPPVGYYFTDAIDVAYYYMPYLVDARLNILKEKEAALKVEIDEDDYSGNNNLKYKSLTEDVTVKYPAIEEYYAQKKKELEEAGDPFAVLLEPDTETEINPAATSGSSDIQSSSIKNSQTEQDQTFNVNNYLPNSVDTELNEMSAAYMMENYNNLQKLMFGMVKPEEVNIINQSINHMMLTAETDKYKAFLNMDAYDRHNAYIAGVYKSKDEDSPWMNVLAKTDKSGVFSYLLLQPQDGQTVYSSVLQPGRVLSLFDVVLSDDETLPDFAKLIEEEYEEAIAQIEGTSEQELYYYNNKEERVERDRNRKDIYETAKEIGDYYAMNGDLAKILDNEEFPSDLEEDTEDISEEKDASDVFVKKDRSKTGSEGIDKEQNQKTIDEIHQEKIRELAEGKENGADESDSDKGIKVPPFIMLFFTGVGAMFGVVGKNVYDANKSSLKAIKMKEVLNKLKQKISNMKSTAQHTH